MSTETTYTLQEKTLLAHLAIHDLIQTREPDVLQIFGGDDELRKSTLRKLRDSGVIKHYRRKVDSIELIAPKDPICYVFQSEAQKGLWEPCITLTKV